MDNKLCLGTVQLGMKYGIKNELGRQPTKQECFSILDCAIENGITYFDTASVYGDAEEILGEYGIGNKNVKVISKLKPGLACDMVKTEILASLNRLQMKSLHGYLLHQASDFYRMGIMWQLMKCKERGFIQNIGVSVYEPVDALRVVKSRMCDFIQIPYNVFDRRLDETDFFEIAQKNNVKVFARSAFLQGLLLMKAEQLPSYLKQAEEYLTAFEKIAENYHFTRKEAALLFNICNKNIFKIVFGVDSKSQLWDNIYNVRKAKSFDLCYRDLTKYIAVKNEKILNPVLWRK